MNSILEALWLIPTLPLIAAGATAFCRRERRAAAATLAISSLAASLLLALLAFAATIGSAGDGEAIRQYRNFDWLQLGPGALRLGWMLDPLGAAMLVMVSFVGLVIFVYSVGYMAHDDNFTRFFCFLSLFAAAMLGLVMANSLLLLFICWELVGLASYLLIGFWYQKPSAAAAAKKAFVVTRIGDLGLFLGMLWLYGETGTLLFYDQGSGCLESTAIAGLLAQTTIGGLAVSTAVGLLIFCGAIGKSGQLPLHVWLPDAMEGPTPVSALIHAATMVAAGVFLVARVYPLMSAAPAGCAEPAAALTVVTWVGALTAVFAALIAAAQTDLKRILAYSTVSQLGYMFLGLGVGGIAVGMFHLITHAFFKALLFLGAGSVIHGCHEEQDIRHMGGLRKAMPITFATYAAGMLALSGVPLFAGFWSKDEILHAAQSWPVSLGPFLLGLVGALLTAFYMTRQVAMVFFGEYRGTVGSGNCAAHASPSAPARGQAAAATPGPRVHESPAVMTAPLIVLAVFAVILGFIGTPFWPWFQSYLGTAHASPNWGAILGGMTLSTTVVAAGLVAGWWMYGRKPIARPDEPDPLSLRQPAVFDVLRRKFLVDELYEATVVAWHARFGRLAQWLEAVLFETAVLAVSYLVVGLSWISRWLDEYGINLGFDAGCDQLRRGGGHLSRWHDDKIRPALRVLALALTVLLLLLLWGGNG